MPAHEPEPMLSPYTTTITQEAVRRGISVRVVDPSVPVFELCCGARTVPGKWMLVHQAAEQLRLWSGREPPLEVMARAFDEAGSR